MIELKSNRVNWRSNRRTGQIGQFHQNHPIQFYFIFSYMRSCSHCCQPLEHRFASSTPPKTLQSPVANHSTPHPNPPACPQAQQLQNSPTTPLPKMLQSLLTGHSTSPPPVVRPKPNCKIPPSPSFPLPKSPSSYRLPFFAFKNLIFMFYI